MASLIDTTSWLHSAAALIADCGVSPDMLRASATAITSGTLLLATWLIYLLLNRYVVPSVIRLVRFTSVEWDDILFNPRLLKVVCELLWAIAMRITIPGTLAYYPALQSAATIGFRVLIVVVVVHLINRFLVALSDLAETHSSGRVSSLRGIRQMLQVISVSVGAIIIISILANRNPTAVITGLGAAATVLMLVFKDSIMGVVAGVQLTLNDMLRPGDWITVPARNINGTVLEVGLTTVKVQNFDKTIVTVPPYTLITESFQNWRGMSESGGRRINRSITIDLNTIGYIAPAQLHPLLTEPWAEGLDPQAPHINVTLLRRYLEHYISTHPALNASPGMTHMVRELAPTPNGLPIDLYFFVSPNEWKAYEHIQADIMDHILATVPRFGLRIYQSPSGLDIRESFSGKNI